MSVEQGLCSGYTAQVLGINKNYYFPYASDIPNAANNTNIGVPGKYVVDLNGKYVIVLIATRKTILWLENANYDCFYFTENFPCYCKKRILAMACQIRKQISEDLPALCQEFQ